MPILAGAPRVPEGLFDRVFQIMEMIERVPDDFSDEESRGVIALMPSDVA